MSKVFSAKLNSVEFSYELPDGAVVKLSYRSPTTAEIDESVRADDNPLENIERAKASFRARLGGDKKTVEAVIADQQDNGNLYEFIGELEAALADAKAAKKRS